MLANIVGGFSTGICAIISADFSKLIMSKDISKTKRYAWLSTTIVLVFSFSLFCILYAKRVFLAEILINDKNIHHYIEEMLLAFLVWMFACISMFVIYGIIRGLGKEKIYVVQLMAFYVISIFMVLFLILIGAGKNLLYISCLFGEALSVIAGIVIICQSDWRKEADDIVKQSE